MKPFQNIYFDKKNHRFSIFIDPSGALSFVYWHVLKKHGFRMLEADQFVQAELSPPNKAKIRRGLGFESLALMPAASFQATEFTIYRHQCFDQKDLLELTSKANHKAVFIECEFSEIELEGHVFKDSLAFLDCTFKQNFRLLHTKIYGDVWLPNCTFKQHFSLKESSILGDVHLESSNFTGTGGASFRGIHAQNVFLDLGVAGGQDLFWLNEMVIENTLSIGGSFQNEIQILGHQDADEECGVESTIGHIQIGVELYEFENANRTHISSPLRLNGFKTLGTIQIRNLKAERFECIDLSAELLSLHNVNVETDMVLQSNDVGHTPCVNSAGIQLTDCSIGRHLKIQDNQFSGALSLNGSAVSENTYLENNDYCQHSKLDIRRFTASRVLISPADFLTRYAPFRIFSPKEFSLLQHSNKEELGDQYCALKNWLADSGRMELEDMAYFHMRQCYQNKVAVRALFGGAFGWGVRLSNIGVSCGILILLFGAIFSVIDEKIMILKALSLSTQSFISSFFGKWDDYQPDGLLSNLVTLESVIGVILITVFVGAYIRKLLR
ncbi:hypothetical protein [Aliiglaciecola litoralis]|uniref:Pentapeptide repeat-containing protein n=1 Tax=Aliiglaciecola litoralis TaxID=582857 RepID=A0ABN1LQA7_9ALTE